ncbi:MAG: Uma2 family endonuclease [Chloroflexota bacterium]
MVAPDKKKVVTVREFERFITRSENTERLFELINGQIVEKVPKQLHALIAALFASAFVTYFREHPLGWVFVEVRVKLPNSTINDLIPDVAAALEECRTLDEDEPLTYMPEIVVEIQSPDQSDKFMIDKANVYLAHGARIMIIVYASKRLIEVLRPDDRILLIETDTLELGDLLPGFAVPVEDLFPRK